MLAPLLFCKFILTALVCLLICRGSCFSTAAPQMEELHELTPRKAEIKDWQHPGCINKPWKCELMPLVQRAGSRIHFSSGLSSLELRWCRINNIDGNSCSRYWAELLSLVWSQQFPPFHRPVSVIDGCVLVSLCFLMALREQSCTHQSSGGWSRGNSPLSPALSSSCVRRLALEQEIKGCRKATFGL